MSEANKAIVRKIEEAWNNNDLESLNALFAPGFQQHSAFPGSTPSLATAKQAHQLSLQAMPDRKTEVQELIAEGDQVVVRMRLTGTNTGGFSAFGIPANGNAADFEWISIYRLKDGVVTEHRAVGDPLTFMQQMGVVPAPAR